MSSQAFEITCPICRSVVPLDAPSCPTCARNKSRDTGTTAAPAAVAVAPRAQAPTPDPAGFTAPDLRALNIKDYHRVVRATYNATEGPATGASRARAYLPFVLLVLLLIAGAAVIFGHMP